MLTLFKLDTPAGAVELYSDSKRNAVYLAKTSLGIQHVSKIEFKRVFIHVPFTKPKEL